MIGFSRVECLNRIYKYHDYETLNPDSQRHHTDMISRFNKPQMLDIKALQNYVSAIESETFDLNFIHQHSIDNDDKTWSTQSSLSHQIYIPTKKATHDYYVSQFFQKGKDSESGKIKKNMYRAASYDPLVEGESIYTELAKLKPFEIPSKFQKFIKAFGLPMGFSSEYNTLRPQYSEKKLIAFHAMDVLEFYKELTYFRFLFYLWQDLQEKEDSLLICKASFLFDQMYDKQKISDFASLFKMDASTPHQKAKHFLTSALDKQSKGVSTFEVINDKIKPAIRFDDLFQVAYFQLSQSIINDVPLVRCKNCGALFETSHRSRKFCPPFPGRKRSTCENTYNQRMKRLRQKQKQKGEK